MEENVLISMLADNVSKWKKLVSEIEREESQLIQGEDKLFRALRDFWERNDFEPDKCKQLLSEIAAYKNKHPSSDFKENLMEFRGLCNNYYTKDKAVFEAFQKALGGKKSPVPQPKHKHNPKPQPQPKPVDPYSRQEPQQDNSERQNKIGVISWIAIVIVCFSAPLFSAVIMMSDNPSFIEVILLCIIMPLGLFGALYYWAKHSISGQRIIGALACISVLIFVLQANGVFSHRIGVEGVPIEAALEEPQPITVEDNRNNNLMNTHNEDYTFDEPTEEHSYTEEELDIPIPNLDIIESESLNNISKIETVQFDPNNNNINKNNYRDYIVGRWKGYFLHKSRDINGGKREGEDIIDFTPDGKFIINNIIHGTYKYYHFVDQVGDKIKSPKGVLCTIPNATYNGSYPVGFYFLDENVIIQTTKSLSCFIKVSQQIKDYDNSFNGKYIQLKDGHALMDYIKFKKFVSAENDVFVLDRFCGQYIRLNGKYLGFFEYDKDVVNDEFGTIATFTVSHANKTKYIFKFPKTGEHPYIINEETNVIYTME